MGSRTTERLWTSIDSTFKEILAHPFVRGLGDGSLERDAFRFYVVQDALYLTQYARALSLCSAKAPHEHAVKMFAEHAAGAIAVERQLHDGFLREFEIHDGDLRETEMAPTNLAYTSYLLAVAHAGSFAEALGAVLPCYWIYLEVGKTLLSRGSPDALYRRWIETYGGEEFAAIVHAVLTLADDVGDGLSGDEEARMARHFRTTARYEWMFWDMGYRMEAWPL